MNFGSWNMSNLKTESEVISVAIYSEKIAYNAVRVSP